MRIIGTFWKNYRASLEKGIIGRKKRIVYLGLFIPPPPLSLFFPHLKKLYLPIAICTFQVLLTQQQSPRVNSTSLEEMTTSYQIIARYWSQELSKHCNYHSMPCDMNMNLLCTSVTHYI